MSELTNDQSSQEVQPEANNAPVNQTPPPTSMFDAPNNIYSSEEQPMKPNNNLVLSIVATAVSLCTCCGYVSCIGVVLGIIAIVFSTQVDSKYRIGDFDGAEKAAKNSKLLSYIALGTVAISLIWIIISIVTVGAGAFIEEYQRLLEQRGY